jgi:hypothetical protein
MSLSVRVIQFETVFGRRVGVVEGWSVRDVTSTEPRVTRVVDACAIACADNSPLAERLLDWASRSPHKYAYASLLDTTDLADGPVLRAPFDHLEPSRVMVSGTGLTHLGSVKSRDAMHAVASDAAKAAPVTDSQRMFEWGCAGGRPATGARGTPPEWFYKGNGHAVSGPNGPLTIPAFAEDGGEEPEIVGCYWIDPRGKPRRAGFAVGNEWSDHAFEKRNYLYLAPSKLRACAIGPELVVGHDFQEIELRCTVTRAGRTIYDSGPLMTGERHMCHSLANLEDHHFKFAGHRTPGDVHLHFFGTSRLSYGERDWVYDDGDEIRIAAPDFSATLVNTVRREPRGDVVQSVETC